MEQKYKAIIVLGMHRSGTSAITGVLNQLGVPLGKNLFPAQKGVNDKGFWENGTIVELDDELLLSVGSCWDDWLELEEGWDKSASALRCKTKIAKAIRKDFSKTPLWAVKDPRMCRLLPLWKDVLAEANTDPFYLLMVRHPSQVVKSLVKRDGFSMEKSILLWLGHNLDAERLTRSDQRMVIFFDQLLTETMSVIDELKTGIQTDFPVDVNTARASIEDFLSGNLAHHSDTQFSVDNELTRLADRTVAAMALLSKNKKMKDAESELDKIYEEFEAYTSRQNPLLIEQIRYLARERGKYQVIWENISQLWTWKFLRPFRFIEKKLRVLK